jgi:hypothetical protein
MGPVGTSSPSSQVLPVAPTPKHPSRFTSFPRYAIPSQRLEFAPASARRSGRWPGFGHGFPSRIRFGGDIRVSQVPAQPNLHNPVKTICTRVIYSSIQSIVWPGIDVRSLSRRYLRIARGVDIGGRQTAATPMRGNVRRPDDDLDDLTDVEADKYTRRMLWHERFTWRRRSNQVGRA